MNEEICERIVSLAGTRWFTAYRPGRGYPVFIDPAPPWGRACVAAYTTRQACLAGLALYPDRNLEIVEVDASAFNAREAARGLTVIVDLTLGERPVYKTFEPASGQ